MDIPEIRKMVFEFLPKKLILTYEVVFYYDNNSYEELHIIGRFSTIDEIFDYIQRNNIASNIKNKFIKKIEEASTEYESEEEIEILNEEYCIEDEKINDSLFIGTYDELKKYLVENKMF